MPIGIDINSSERVLLAGKTGSGKTHLARAFLARVTRLIVIDSKFNLDPVRWNCEIIRGIPRGELPDQFRWILRADDLEDVGARLLQENNFYLYIDEMYAVFPSAQKAAAGWRGIWTRGRENGIGLWAGVQRPTSIPLVAISEADHYFIFRLNMPEDRDRMSGVVGITVSLLPQFSFYYAHPTSETYWRVGRLDVV